MRKDTTAPPPPGPGMRKLLKYGVAMAVIAAAAGLRIWPLGALELRIAWVTFYPAVMAAALYGGFSPGLLATAFSVLVVLFWSPTGAPFIDDPGDWLGMAVFSVNGTLISLMSGAMHRAREQAIRSKEQAEAANKAKSVFLSNMSHELRTPLNAILGFAEILKGVEVDAKKAQYVEYINTSGHALLTLINDILDLSKIEAGKMELQYSAISMQSFFSETRTLFDRKITDKGLELILEVGEEVPAALALDETRLRQIIINLIGNAVKFTDTGYIRLHASTEETDNASASGVELTIAVTDSGIGIPKDQQEKIFGTFEQVKGQKTSEFSGTGLGLAITRRLVELMDGEISVESEAAKGATFSVVLHGVEVAATEALQSKKETRIDLENITFAPATILIVDDIDYNREILTTYLEPFHLDFIYAENGREAIDRAEENRPDLILLDMKMPVMDGYKASERLHGIPQLKGVPIIAVTASALKQDEEVISSLCDGYLRKKVSKVDLVVELMRFLPHSNPARQAEAARETKGPTDLSPEALAEEIAALPETWRNEALELARICRHNELQALLTEVGIGYPAVTAAIQHHLETFRFDLIVNLLDLSPQTPTDRAIV